MEERGLLTWAALGLVLVVAGLAFADSLRGCDRASTVAATPSTTQPETSDEPGEQRPEAPAGWPEGLLAGVLTFVDADDCTIRAIGLSGGRERPGPSIETACAGFWPAQVGDRLAYEEPPSQGETFRFVDLSRSFDELGSYALTEVVHWSADGQRAAWCADRERDIGNEREILGDARAIPFCPIAYTTDGRLARADGGRLIVDRRTVAEIPGRIYAAEFGFGGAIAIVDEFGRIHRFGGPEPVVTSGTSGTGAIPTYTSDLCRATFVAPGGVVVAELGCNGRVRRQTLSGAVTAAWSPEGAWLAVATPNEIQFYPSGSLDEPPPIVWPARAVNLAWRP